MIAVIGNEWDLAYRDVVEELKNEGFVVEAIESGEEDPGRFGEMKNVLWKVRSPRDLVSLMGTREVQEAQARIVSGLSLADCIVVVSAGTTQCDWALGYAAGCHCPALIYAGMAFMLSPAALLAGNICTNLEQVVTTAKHICAGLDYDGDEGEGGG